MVLLKELIQEAEEKYGYKKHKPQKTLKPINNNTGFYRVTKIKRPNNHKKYAFKYTSQKKSLQIQIERADILNLKYEITRRGLPWEVLNELIARKTVNDEGYSWELFE